MKKSLLLFMLSVVIFGISACKKDNENGPNDLGGETNIPLTQVGNESSLYLTIGSGGSSVNGTMTVIKNEKGVITYNVIADLTGNPDSAFIAALVPAEYKDNQGRITGEFKFKITSEGIQDYFHSNKPWTVVKYEDEVGDSYSITTENGDVLTRTVVEKTGIDEWPLGFFNIKTVAVEQGVPESDELLKKITYRANHKFGLVYIKAELKNGQVVEADIVPWFLL
jgi:hypothetical protein